MRTGSWLHLCGGLILVAVATAYWLSTAESGGVAAQYERWGNTVNEVLQGVPIVTVGDGETFDLLVRGRLETQELLHSDQSDLLTLLAAEVSRPIEANEIRLLPELICAAVGVSYSDTINHVNQIAHEVEGAASFEFIFGKDWLPPSEVRRLMGYLILCEKAGRPVMSYLRRLYADRSEHPQRTSQARNTLDDKLPFQSIMLWGRSADVQDVPDSD